MKRLLLTRHAEAGLGDGMVSDHDRLLTLKGKNDARNTSDILQLELSKVEHVYVSSSKRAQETAINLGVSEERRSILSELYTFDSSALMQVISNLNTKADYIQIIAHNPAITEFVNFISDTFIPNVPPCGVVLLQWDDCQKWSDISNEKATAIKVEFP